MSKNDRYCSVGNSKGNAGAVRDWGTASKKTAKTKAWPQKGGRGGTKVENSCNYHVLLPDQERELQGHRPPWQGPAVLCFGQLGRKKGKGNTPNPTTY